MCFRPAAVGGEPIECPKCGFKVAPTLNKCPKCGATAEDFGAAPGMPGIPAAPGMPAAPGVPAAPGMPAAPGVPAPGTPAK